MQKSEMSRKYQNPFENGFRHPKERKSIKFVPVCAQESTAAMHPEFGCHVRNYASSLIPVSEIAESASRPSVLT